VKLRNDLIKKDYQQELAVQDKRAVLTALMGGDGLKGSLDSLSYAIEEKEVDSIQEAA